MQARTMFSATPAVVGYLPDYECTAKLVQNLNNTNWTGLTQVNYFSVQPNAATGALPGVGGDSSSGYGLSHLQSVVSAAHAQGVKVSIVVGGAGLDGSLRSIINGSDGLQKNFADSVQHFATAFGVDGVDLDWEPQGVTATEVANYGHLIDTLKNNNAAGLTLSAAVAAEPQWLAPSYDSTAHVLNATAAADLDAINVMTYDLGNPADGAPVTQSEADMQNWVTQAGAPADKLLMGLPFYGRGTTLTVAQQPADNPWQNVTDGNTACPSYAQLVAHAPAGTVTGASANLSVTKSIPGVLGGKSVAYQFDGTGTIAAKTAFAVDSGYAGVMAWSLGQDDFNADGSYAADALLPVVQQPVAGHTNTTPTAPATKLTGTVIGTAGSYHNRGNTAAKAFDGDASNFYDGAPANGNRTGLDLGTAHALTGVTFAPRVGFAYRMAGGTFHASNAADFSSWTMTLYTISGTPDAGTTTATVTAAGRYRYVRYLAPAQSYGSVAEVCFTGTSSQQQLVVAAAFADAATIGSDDRK